MAATDAPEAKKQKVEGAAGSASKLIYIVRWTAHESVVGEWVDEELEKIETTCDDDIGEALEEAKDYIRGDLGDSDALLQADGLRSDDGTIGKAFSTIAGAREGLVECHDARVAATRSAIRNRLGIDGGLYEALLEDSAIVENSWCGQPPPSANVHPAPGTMMATEIGWGPTGYNSPESNNADQHEFIRCLDDVATRVTCWIETLELE